MTLGCCRETSPCRLDRLSSCTASVCFTSTMPELPDILLYQHSLEQRVRGQTIERIRLASPFLLRSVEPPITEAEGRTVLGIERVGKRLVFALEEDWFLVLHLMIAGRLKWLDTGAKLPGRIGLAAFDFPTGTPRAHGSGK